MKKTAYGQPLFLSNGNQPLSLKKKEATDELEIQKLIFDHPQCLPISDIDEAYNPIIPVCMEMGTSVGSIDILMISPDGGLVIIETKLWRNPEARRKVIGQILDYAKELASWTYEDLQREVNKRLKTKGNTIYKIAATSYPHLTPPESDFVDSVSRNLATGNFLLLIAGDGIREGARGISEFLSNAGNLNFTFSMVELSIYENDQVGRLVVPKTIVKTTELSRVRVEIADGLKISIDESPINTDLLSSKKEDDQYRFYREFWSEFVREIEFDDPGQPLPNPANAQNLYVYPGNTKKAWISAYFMNSQNRVGVYFKTQNDQEGYDINEKLIEFEEELKSELNQYRDIWWYSISDFGIRHHFDNVLAENNREEIKNFFKTWLNSFVNLIRPKMKRIGY